LLKKMHKFRKILFIFLILLTIASLVLSFYNSVVKENFQIVNQGE
jgi:hypothetical protein